MTIASAADARVAVAGKFLQLGAEKFYVKGFSYGPFAPNSDGEPLPERPRLRDDFAHIRELGGNTIRVYFPPPEWLLDEALHHGLRVFIDVPWEKHRCFFEDWGALDRARDRVRTTARELGNHPGVLAISVVNEFPVDIVRFQGRRRVERFVEELLAIAKDEAPDCLATFVNFPTTEFLEVDGCDFSCFNVYVHDQQRFGNYLDRLQHIAGDKPLVLGEYGIDSLREGAVEQSAMLSRHLKQVFRHGLAGSLIFAFTDDWFTGGHQIDDWFFGVTCANRGEKLAAQALRGLWRELPHGTSAQEEFAKVSVIVCSYNGSATLRECLESLMSLDYPDFEVILVDDGSTDETALIAGEFPQIIYRHQENRGLSAARNVGAEMASGEIVAYTDDDCVVDSDWLRYLVQAMRDQRVEAIGGPNITPNDDGWIAKCVAASPGNPSHVMLDDHHAEHVPGCNMAFRRSTLLGLGGFDPQFRVAGDDVDICWRFLDADLPIGYAAGAMVYHRRRATVRAYAKQQRGYGRSEAMVHFKHPHRCGAFGRSSWTGIIYGDGAVGLPLLPDRIYHGRFGSGLFQTIYRHNEYGFWSVMMSLEWHLSVLFLLLLATLYWPFAILATLMELATVTLAIRSAVVAPLNRGAPWWARPLIAYLYFMQPIWRGWKRMTALLRSKQLPDLATGVPDLPKKSVKSPSQADRDSQFLGAASSPEAKQVSVVQRDMYWESDDGAGREHLLEEIVSRARALGWPGDYDNAWAEWDVRLVGDSWHDITIRTATEELGWPKRFTRASCRMRPTVFNWVVSVGSLVWTAIALATGHVWAVLGGLVICCWQAVSAWHSTRKCMRTTEGLLLSGRVLAPSPISDQEMPELVSEPRPSHAVATLD